MSFVPRRLRSVSLLPHRPFFAGEGRNILHILLAVMLGIGGGLAVVVLPNPVIGFALAAGLVAVVLMLSHPLFTVGTVITIACLLPFGVIPIRVGLTFTLLESALLFLFLGWLLHLSIGSNGQTDRLVTSPFDWAIFLFTGLSIFALILSLQTSGSNDIIHNYVKLILSILAFFPVLNLVRNQKALDRLLQTLIFCGALAGYIGVGLYLLNRDLQERLLTALGRFGYPTEGRILRFDLDDPTRAQRATGTSVDPNSFGGMLVLIFALLLTQLLSPKPLFKRWIVALMLPGPTIALYLTYGRGVQLGALGVIALIATVKYRRLWLYVLPFVAAGVLVLPNTFLWSRFAAGFSLQDPSAQLHLAEFGNAFAIIGRYPLFGIGFGPAPDPDLQAGVSSVYLTIAERMGLSGLFGFLLVIGLYLVFLTSNFSKILEEKQKANLLGLASGVVGALFVGVLDHYFFNIEFAHMAALLWLFIALSVAQIKLAVHEP